jgi:hypothetical protein
MLLHGNVKYVLLSTHGLMSYVRFASQIDEEENLNQRQ